MMPTAGAKVQKADERARMVEVYVKAAQIFQEKGFDATSMSDLAEALQITKAGLYYYIKSKQDLLFDIMSHAMDWLEQEVIAPALAESDPEKRLLLLIERHGRRLIEGSHAIPILTDEVSALRPKHRGQILARKRVYFDLVRNTLDDLRRQDKLRDVDTTVATYSFFGMLLWLPRWYSPAGRLSSDQVLENLTRLILGGLLKVVACSEGVP